MIKLIHTFRRIQDEQTVALNEIFALSGRVISHNQRELEGGEKRIEFGDLPGICISR